MNEKDKKRCKVGELRPSQALTTFGIGAIIDLPHLSVMVMGLEDWPFKDTVEIGEQRLLASVKEVLGPQVKALRSAPVVPDTYQVNQFDSSALVGIPVAPFPRWMVCPYCRRLAPLGSGLFKLETPYRTDQIRYVHANCTKPGKPPTVVPARFVVACKNGHLDDFPWRQFVHQQDKPTCQGGLKLLEPSATGEAALEDHAAHDRVNADGAATEREGAGQHRAVDSDGLARRGHGRPSTSTPSRPPSPSPPSCNSSAARSTF